MGVSSTLSLVCLFILSTTVLNPQPVEAYTQNDLYGLLNFLFNDYKPEVRPTYDGEATYVYISIYLLSIQDLYEINQVLETSIVIEADWTDDFLAWNESEHGGIDYVFYPQEKIWLPDVIIENSVERQKQMGYDENKVRIDSSGLIVWKPSQIAKTSCDIDVTYYPFDTQTCNIIISTWVSGKDDIDIDPDKESNRGLILTKYSKSGTWELVSNSLEVLPNEGDLTRIQFTLKMKRLRKFYILNIILPVLFLTITSAMVFFLPADAGEKIGMSITILLAYTVYLIIIADNMPQTSLQVSYLAVYLTLMLGINAMGVVFAVIVLHFHHKSDDDEISPKTKSFIRSLRKLVCISNEVRVEETPPLPENPRHLPPLNMGMRGSPYKYPHQRAGPLEINNRYIPAPDYKVQEEEITWRKVGEAIDRLMFYLTSFLIAVITVVFLTILATGDS